VLVVAINSIEVTVNAVRRQIAAMGAAAFEVGLYRPEIEGSTGPEMLPRTWDREMLLKSVPWMRLQNLLGRNVYIRPQGEHNLSLLDDLTAQALLRLRASGFRPALVVETSPGNFQAWLKHKEVLPRTLSTCVAKKLAEKFGADIGAADWRHFGRLSGFTNRKRNREGPDGRFPFVRLIEASGASYPEAERFVNGVREELERAEATRRAQAAKSAAAPTARAGPLRPIDAFRSNPLYAGDGNRIDLAYAVYALAHGADPTSIDAAIRTRDLSHKGNEKRQSDYVKRTIDKAAATIERGRGMGR
jgi:hypothetical protein